MKERFFPLYPKDDLEKIGGGSEKDVFTIRNRPDLVVGIFKPEKDKASDEYVKARFYLTKILNYFFPNEIPDIHASFNKPETVLVDKVDTDNDHVAFNVWEKKNYEGEPIEPELLAGANRHMEKANSNPKLEDFNDRLYSEFGVELESGIQNYSISSNGDLVFLDSFEPWDDWCHLSYFDIGVNFDLDKIRYKISMVRSEKDRNKLNGWADRLAGLTIQGKEALRKKNLLQEEKEKLGKE